MNKPLLGTGVRLIVLCALITAVSLSRADIIAYSTEVWDDSDYFDAVYACDANYYGTLNDCRSGPFYPFDPDESQCRFNAGDSYTGCLLGIQGPTYDIDFAPWLEARATIAIANTDRRVIPQTLTRGARAAPQVESIDVSEDWKRIPDAVAKNKLR